VFEHLPVTPYPGIVIEIADNCSIYHWQDKEVCFGPLHGSYSKLKLRPMNRIPGLKPYNPAPTKLSIHAPYLFRTQPVLLEIRVDRQTYDLEFAADVVITRLVKQIVYTWMREICCTINCSGFPLRFNEPDIIDMHNGQKKTLLIPYGN